MCNYYEDTDGSGVIGVIITIIMYSGILILNCFVFYNYLVFLHMEGRIIDIFNRVTADVHCFFIPYDNEVSARYLRWIIAKIQHENDNLRGATQYGMKHAAVTYHTVTNEREGVREETTYICVYRRSTRFSG